MSAARQYLVTWTTTYYSGSNVRTYVVEMRPEEAVVFAARVNARANQNITFTPIVDLIIGSTDLDAVLG